VELQLGSLNKIFVIDSSYNIQPFFNHLNNILEGTKRKNKKKRQKKRGTQVGMVLREAKGLSTNLQMTRGGGGLTGGMHFSRCKCSE